MLDYTDFCDDYTEEDHDSDCAALNHQDQLEQKRWEEENDVKSILDSDPGYHKWADEMDRQADEDREIMALAEIEAERNFESAAWD